MERKKFIQHFARRLSQVMREKGQGSSRSKAGIDIKYLAKISGSSYQMARKYALGQALPEIPVITKIATCLDCSPSWLLFGENDIASVKHKSGMFIEIESSLLKYILNKSLPLFSLTGDAESVINFIVETVYDAAHLDVDLKTIHKIIDMMISSATLLNKNDQDGKETCSQ